MARISEWLIVKPALLFVFAIFFISKVSFAGSNPPPPPPDNSCSDNTIVTSPASGVYEESVTINISNGSNLRYTTNGSNPTTSSPAYSSALTFTSNTTLKTRGFTKTRNCNSYGCSNYTTSLGKISVANIQISPYRPVISASGSHFEDSGEITLTTQSAGAQIKYTIDDSDPATSSTAVIYSSPFTIYENRTINAITIKSGMVNSEVVTDSFTVSYSQTVSTPEFSPSGGTYNDEVNVAITSATSGASIYYTTDGSDPATSTTSTLYTSEVLVSEDAMLRAIAYKTYMEDSAVSSSGFTIKEDTSGGGAGGGLPIVGEPTSPGHTVAVIPGDFTVSATGAAQYSVPVEVPPGTAGVQPSLTIDYSSSASNGAFGVGWNINGISSIHRCPRTKARDGSISGIQFNNNDRFCLDGQPLIAINGGAYGADGTEYRTEIDTFSRIVSYDADGINGPDSFKVWTKSGDIMEYGTDANSYFNPPHHNGSANNVALCWLVRKVSDTVGNYMLYDYQKNASVGSSMPLSISYTLHESGASATNRILFEFEPRGDVSRKFIGGRQLYASERLSKIKVQYQDSQSWSDLSELRLSYAQDTYTAESHITSITKCDAANNCVPETTFTFADGGEGTYSTQSVTTQGTATTTANIQRRKIVDVNSDGLPDVYYVKKSNSVNDVVYLQNSDGTFSTSAIDTQIKSGSNHKNAYLQFGDFNGDGNVDVLRIKAKFVPEETYDVWEQVCVPIQGCTYQWVTYPVATKVVWGQLPGCNPFAGCSYGWITVPDWRYQDIYENHIYLGNGDGTFGDGTAASAIVTPFEYQGDKTPPCTPGPSGCITTTTVLHGDKRVRLGDFDGDGSTDIFHINYDGGTGNYQHSVHFLGDNGEFTTVNNTGASTYIESFLKDKGVVFSNLPFDRIHFGDFNADGMTDVYYIYGFDGTHTDFVFLSDGDGTFTSQHTGIATHKAEISDQRYNNMFYARYKFVDINGDGNTDILHQGYGCDCGQPVYAYLSNGKGGFRSAINTGISTVVEDDWEDSTTDYQRLFFGDFNGDGLNDIYYAGAGHGSSNQIRLSKGNGTFSGVVTALSQSVGAEGNTAGTNLTRYNMVDVNGDGVTDIYYVANTDTVYISNAKRTLLENITNGLNSEIDIEYATLVDDAVYTRGVPNTVADRPNLMFQGAMTVVKSTMTDDGIGGRNQLDYMYERAKINTEGRGFLGFYIRKVLDHTNDTLITNHYLQEFPFNGLVKLTETEVAGVLVSKEENFYTEKVTDTRYTYAHQSISSTYDFDSASTTPYSIVTTNSVFDEWGNPTQIDVITDDYGLVQNTFTTTTVNQYDNIITDPDRWFLGRLHTATVTKSQTTNQSVSNTTPSNSCSVLTNTTRVSKFEYYNGGENLGGLLNGTGLSSGDIYYSSDIAFANSGLLKREIIMQGNTSVESSSKTYFYDQFGNRTHVVSSGIGVDSRLTSTKYGIDGRFPEETKNALGHTERYEYNDAWGGRTKLIGPNGVANPSLQANFTTTWEYDAFGRVFKEIRGDGTYSVTGYEQCNGACPSIENYVSPQYKRISFTTGTVATVEYFDEVNRVVLTETENFDGSIIKAQTLYDAKGRAASISLPYETSIPSYWTVTEFDVVGRILRERSPSVGTTEYSYNEFVTTMTDEKGQVARQMVNSLEQTLWTEDDAGNRVEFSYDGLGNMVSVSDADNNQTINYYNLLGQRTCMVDPDMGRWTYQHNVFGELTSQTDAKGQVTTMTYDKLGRIETRIEPDDGGTNTATWEYDDAPYGLGKIYSVSDTNDYIKVHSYDTFGRPDSTYETIHNTVYVTTVTYDSYSRVSQTIYPDVNGTRFQIENVYNNRGFLERIQNGGTIYWQADAVDEFGNVTIATLGNNVVEFKDYENNSGRLFSASTVGPAFNSIQGLSYKYDKLGNLEQRQDTIQGLTEDFVYDRLNRLTSASVSGQPVSSYQYDASSEGGKLGNITFKTGVGNYHYGNEDASCGGVSNAGPHAVTSVVNGGNTINYCYDDNGNMTSGNGRIIEWSSFNKPTRITQNGNENIFDYAPDRSRYHHESTVNSNTTTTLYVGGIYEKVVTNTETTHKHFIRAGGQVIAVRTTGDVNHTRYLHRDHLGSVDVITDASGQAYTRLSFDAFGQKRLTNNWAAGVVATLPDDNNTRGYTGHEQLDGTGLIHMNGRVYDPLLGRFLSADPFVQQPHDLQSLNRYSYVKNNPLTYTDPSGFFFKSLAKAFKGVFKGIGKIFKGIGDAIQGALNKIASNPYLAIAASIAVGYGTFALAQSLGANAIVAGAAGGFAGGFVGSGGDFKAAVIGGLTGAAAGWIGSSDLFGGFDIIDGARVAQVTPQRVLAHGVVGGAASEAQGGSFAQGFASSALTKSVSRNLADLTDRNPIAGGIASAVVAGTISKLTGGKFQSGAVTVAYQYLYNELQGRAAAEARKNDYARAKANPNGKYLLYDGKDVLIVDETNNQVIYTVPASSGTGEGLNNPALQDVAFVGPIPEGGYYFDSADWNYQSLPRQVYNIAAGNGDWGSYNVRLTPINAHPVRDSFYLHGGFFRGSAGCLDCGGNIGRIQSLVSNQDRTYLFVKY